MPAGAVCSCGNLTSRLSRRCEPCERRLGAQRRARERVYSDARWERCRLICLARDDWRCDICSSQDRDNARQSLDVHHTMSVLEILARGFDPFDPLGCVTRCKTCHGATR